MEGSWVLAATPPAPVWLDMVLGTGVHDHLPLKPFLQARGSGEAEETDQRWPQLVRGVCASKPFTAATVRRTSLERRRRKQQPTPVLLPGGSHGQRSLAGYSPGGRKESDVTVIHTQSSQGHRVGHD